MIEAVVTDIEGTTTPIAFVKDVLFPHARAALPAFVAARASEPAVRAALDEAKALAGDAAQSDAAITRVLLRWIDEDRKSTPLKALQGVIWEDGFRAGAYAAPVYPDVPPALARWRAAGLRLYVFSSGSVLAQRLLFAHTDAGDLLPLFDGFFDTTTGPKQDPAAYARIAAAIGAPPAHALFLSDVAAELDAAARAGMQCVGLAREGAALAGEHPVATRFDEIDLAGGRASVVRTAP